MKNIGSSSKERVLDSGLVLISVVVIFLFCWTPTIVFYFCFDVYKAVNNDFKYSINNISYCAIIFNSSSNFFIYCLVGKRYRQHVKEAFTCFSTGSKYIYFQHPITLCLRYEKYYRQDRAIPPDSRTN